MAKIHRYFYIEVDNLADRGFNKAVELYKLQYNDYPKIIGGNYRLDSASWKGYKSEAREILYEKCNHNLPLDVYEGKLFLKDINGN